MKRSVNFAGSAATARRKITPDVFLRACRKLGMSDEEIVAMLERVKEKKAIKP